MLITELLTEYIVKQDDQWCVKSLKKNRQGHRKNLGCYDSRAGAEQRLGQVDYFKHANESYDEDDEDYAELHSINTAKQLIPELLKSAQHAYDKWDETDRDTYAGGGICHIIAENICSVLSSAGIDCVTVSCNFDQHVYVAAVFREGTYTIDIPYSIYEEGAAYSWKKLPDVEFEIGDIEFYRVGPISDFKNYTMDY